MAKNLNKIFVGALATVIAGGILYFFNVIGKPSVYWDAPLVSDLNLILDVPGEKNNFSTQTIIISTNGLSESRDVRINISSKPDGFYVLSSNFRSKPENRLLSDGQHEYLLFPQINSNQDIRVTFWKLGSGLGELEITGVESSNAKVEKKLSLRLAIPNFWFDTIPNFLKQLMFSMPFSLPFFIWLFFLVIQRRMLIND